MRIGFGLKFWCGGGWAAAAKPIAVCSGCNTAIAAAQLPAVPSKNGRAIGVRVFGTEDLELAVPDPMRPIGALSCLAPEFCEFGYHFWSKLAIDFISQGFCCVSIKRISHGLLLPLFACGPCDGVLPVFLGAAD